MTLLEKALEAPVNHQRAGRKASSDLRDRCELAIAYMGGKVDLAQVSAATGGNHLGARSALASAIMAGWRAGIVSVRLES